MRSNAGMANRQGDDDLRVPPLSSLAWFGLVSRFKPLVVLTPEQVRLSSLALVQDVGLLGERGSMLNEERKASGGERELL
jgi:hypothetical protein